MIPLVSSLCAGPLGMCQLPRTWWKVSLHAAGRLDDDYPEATGGLDSMVLERLGLDKAQTLAHIHAERPDYLSFEAWVVEQVGAPAASVREEWNGFIVGRVHKPAKIDDIYGTLGWAPDAGVDSAVVLNHLEDWHFWYERDLPGDELASWKGRTVPLVSTLDYGTLGVCQLPRTWHKVLLEAAGLLHEEYPGLGGGLDKRVVVDVLGLERDEVNEHLTTSRPSYLVFEDWVREKIGDRDVSAAVSEWNDLVRHREHHAEKRADIHNNLGRADDGSLPASAAVLNLVEDLHLAHTTLMAG
jgi:hypothetical protein